MKKFALAALAVAFIGFGSAPASALSDEPTQEIPPEFEIECGEEGPDSENCAEFYEEVEVAPPTTAPPETTTTTVAAVAPPQTLPRTGGGVSPILGIGALLFVGGGIVVVASRRRSTATSAA